MNGTKYLWILSLLICSQVSADYDPYGLLFTSPDQRSRLDKRFTKNAMSDSVQAGSEQSEFCLPVEVLPDGGKKRQLLEQRILQPNIANQFAGAARARMAGHEPGSLIPNVSSPFPR